MSHSAATSSTCAPRRRGVAKRATTCREGQELLRSYQSGVPLEHSMCASRGLLEKLKYMDIKQILYRKAIENKQGTLTTGEIQLLVQEIHDC
jgi:hypothetical protein